jgi:hypothetical protein
LNFELKKLTDSYVDIFIINHVFKSIRFTSANSNLKRKQHIRNKIEMLFVVFFINYITMFKTLAVMRMQQPLLRILQPLEISN